MFYKCTDRNWTTFNNDPTYSGKLVLKMFHRGQQRTALVKKIYLFKPLRADSAAIRMNILVLINIICHIIVR